MTEWETAPAVAETPEIKLFGKWSTDDVQINDISLQVSSMKVLLIKFWLIVNEARLESRLNTDLLSWCARVLAEENVSAYSLAVVWCGPVNHRLRHMISSPLFVNMFCLNLYRRWLLKPFSLQDYIAVKEKYAKYLPHSGGRYAAKRFRKAQCPIVERLTNSMMMHGRNNGKKLMTVRIVKHAFEIIHLLTGEVCTTYCNS